MTVNVYEQYFQAEHEANGVARRAALTALTADSQAGHIRYEISVTFFPHRDEEDYAVSYDDAFRAVVYDAPGRRSRRREAALLEALAGQIDALAAPAGGRVFWDRPLGEARRE